MREGIRTGRWPICGAILLVLAGTAAACASKTKAPTPGGRVAEPCDGQSVLVVDNHLDAEVEVVQSRRGSGARTVIGIAGPGYHEYLIPEGSDYSYSTRRLSGGGTVSATSRPRARDQRAVSLSFQCRER